VITAFPFEKSRNCISVLNHRVPGFLLANSDVACWEVSLFVKSLYSSIFYCICSVQLVFIWLFPYQAVILTKCQFVDSLYVYVVNSTNYEVWYSVIKSYCISGSSFHLHTVLGVHSLCALWWDRRTLTFTHTD